MWNHASAMHVADEMKRDTVTGDLIVWRWSMKADVPWTANNNRHTDPWISLPRMLHKIIFEKTIWKPSLPYPKMFTVTKAIYIYANRDHVQTVCRFAYASIFVLDLLSTTSVEKSFVLRGLFDLEQSCSFPKPHISILKYHNAVIDFGWSYIARRETV